MIEVGPSTVTTALGTVVAIELAQFGYLWRINNRTLRNRAKAKANAEALARVRREVEDV